MYKLKKIFALFLAIALATSFSTVAFASEEESVIPENATKHTIEVTVEPGETFEGNEDGIAPYIWNQIGHTVSGDKTYTLQFTVPERYFAYEVRATDASGNAISGYYKVELLTAISFSTIASCTVAANNQTYKVDNIDLYSTNSTCLFCITNYAEVPISVTITYYSWS